MGLVLWFFLMDGILNCLSIKSSEFILQYEVLRNCIHASICQKSGYTRNILNLNISTTIMN